jgi:DNA-binding NarL/FixJ family response regulator
MNVLPATRLSPDGGEIIRTASATGAWQRSVPLAPENSGAGAGPAERPRILVVEDEYLVAIDIETTLTEAGFEVVGIAASADEAIRLARQQKPRLAIVDIRLAGRRDGIEAAIEMAKTLGVRSIFATAHADPQVRARAEQAAPLGWLSKPYRMESLVAIIRQALKDLQD